MVCDYRNEYLFLLKNFIVESLRSMKVYQNGDDGFDAIAIDQGRDEIIIGAK
jgi:hypothetical protein